MSKKTDWSKKNSLGADDTNNSNFHEPEDRAQRWTAGEAAGRQRKKEERDNDFLNSEQERAIKEHASNSEVPVTAKSQAWPQRRHRKHRRERQQIEDDSPETSSTEQSKPAASELEVTPSAPPHVHVPDQWLVSGPPRSNRASPDKPDDGRKAASPSKISGAAGRSPSQDQSSGGRTIPSIRKVGGSESQFTTLTIDLASPSFDFDGLIPNNDSTNMTGSQTETETELHHCSRLTNGPRSRPDPPSRSASLPPTPSYPVGAEPRENKNQTKESSRSYVVWDKLNSVQDDNALNDLPEISASESDGHASNDYGEGLSDLVLIIRRRLLSHPTIFD